MYIQTEPIHLHIYPLIFTIHKLYNIFFGAARLFPKLTRELCQHFSVILYKNHYFNFKKSSCRSRTFDYKKLCGKPKKYVKYVQIIFYTGSICPEAKRKNAFYI